VIGQTKVSTLQEGFLKEFGLTLRVYDGRSFADPSATLGQVRKRKGSGTGFSVAKNMKVGNLEDKFKEEFGLKVQVAGSDDSYLCDNTLTLNAAQQKDEERRGRKARRQSKANDSGDGTGIDVETDTGDDGIEPSSIDPMVILDWKAEGYKRKINPEEDANAILSIEDPYDLAATITMLTEYCVEQSEGNIHEDFTRDKAYRHLLHVPEWEAAIRESGEFEIYEEDGELDIMGPEEMLPQFLDEDELKRFAFLFMTLIISGLDYDNETEEGSYPPYSNAIFEEQKAGLLVEMLEKLVGQYS
jgi:hypothetical protein